MDNFKIKLDLQKLNGAFLHNLQGKTGTKRCLVIPVDDANLFVGQKGTYLDIIAYSKDNPKFGESHNLRQSISGDKYNSMTDEEKKAIPYIGDMRVMTQQSNSPQNTVQPQQTVQQTFFNDDSNTLPVDNEFPF